MVARESKAQTYPAPVHHYLRHRRAALARHGHLPIAARVKRDMAKAKQQPGPAIVGRKVDTKRLAEIAAEFVGFKVDAIVMAATA
jgi:hypothetical protein